MTLRHLSLILCLAATGASAHDKVKDPSVKARMQLMKEIRQATATLGTMAKDPDTYSKKRAEAARASLLSLSGRVPVAFQDAATDPASEADPAIWRNWADFTAQADALTSAARALDAGSAGGVAAGMRAVGAACSSCHKPYRE